MENQLRNKIIFNKAFYDKEIIMKSLEDFRNALSAKMDEDETTITLMIENLHDDYEKTKNEFCNYVLASMKNVSMV